MMNSTTTAGTAAAEAFLSYRTATVLGGGGVLGFDLDEALKAPWSIGRQIAESDSLVADMPTVFFEDADDDADSSEAINICSVCWEGVGSPAAPGKRVPGCGHVYHADCISAWLHHHDSCPLCRFHISPLQ